jgi:hypothetical protein
VSSALFKVKLELLQHLVEVHFAKCLARLGAEERMMEHIQERFELLDWELHCSDKGQTH